MYQHIRLFFRNRECALSFRVFLPPNKCIIDPCSAKTLQSILKPYGAYVYSYKHIDMLLFGCPYCLGDICFGHLTGVHISGKFAASKDIVCLVA
jgi:hypothetical protein